jgi:hypothetical protein
MSNNRLFLILAVALASFTGCRKDLGNPSWETGIVLPLARTSLTLNDLVTGVQLQGEPDSSVTLVYQNDFYTITPDSLVKLPDTTITKAYNYAFGSINMNGGDYIVTNTTTQTEYDLNGAELLYAIIRSGGLRFEIKSKVKAPIEFNYQIPVAKLNNVPFNITVTIPAATASSDGVYNAFYDLSGYELTLTGLANDRVNTIVTTSSARISPSFAGTVTVLSTDTINSDITFDDLVPEYASGYFGQTSVNVGPETSAFSIFSQVTGGSLQLEDITLDLQIENGIGVDARVRIMDLSSINTNTSSTIPLNHQLVGSNINVNRAWVSGSGLVKTYNNYSLTPQNSNIKQMVENLPDRLGYTISADINPLGNVSGHKDFIYYGQGLRASLNMEVPLSLIATDLALADTVALNISEEEAEKIKQGSFTIFADNGFPLDAALQVYVLDANNNRIDSIMPVINNIDDAPVDASLKVIQKKLTRLVVPVSESKMDKVLSSRKLLLITTFNTAAQPNYIKIYSHYGIDLKISGDFDYEIELE